ncbi:MAG: GMC oxidoreductase [Silicimonas sp.]
MIVDQDYLGRQEKPRVIIVGSGPAGVSLAHRLAVQKIRSLTLEAGGESFEAEVQDDYTGRTEGDTYYDLDTTRLRFLGGSSNHWQGWCRQLDEVDFLPRDDIPEYGWPIRKSDLDPFAEAASDILEVPLASKRRLNEELDEVEFKFSPPVNFAEKYRHFFETSEYAHLMLHAPVQTLTAKEGRIISARIITRDGLPRDVQGGIYVLAAGGIENSRLLLWSNEVSGEPLVQNATTLGKYWMEHPHNYVGQAQLAAGPLKYVSTHNNQKFAAPSNSAMAKYGIMNGTVRMWPVYYGEDRLRDAIKWGICATGSAGAGTLKEMGQQVDCMSEVQVVWEQPPTEGNRVSLDPVAKDRFGVPRPVLHWRRTPLDYRTARIIFELFGTFMVSQGLGRVRAYDHLIEEANYPDDGIPGGHHHMGGTRMADSPRKGIVDRNLKIFGLRNAYIAGSSVFPTGGHANPTFSIVQLSLRLGDHIAKLRSLST